MEQLQQFDFFPLKFDDNGKLVSTQTWTDFKARVAAAGGPTDAIFIAHGFRNDENDARSLYSEFLRTFRANMAKGPVAACARRHAASSSPGCSGPRRRSAKRSAKTSRRRVACSRSKRTQAEWTMCERSSPN